ncbi:hypothetical protein MW290_03140 [Aquincola tertiaricarbonis]|uniref:Large polyvalent protein-associated domain-containing protein n=1 Tax=Aquincola tertiaricarbonis TaxID=391953 RepID=A0ABY4S3P7_AQUTE|nr:LPD7 domain-containing protein [Aquincola tertiaricarbonis]URI07633.1 hypothetical protein MW290_03140 [Aquincola tertiaricarbonis]
MDDVPVPVRPAPAGGSVEPANRATVAKARFQAPAEPASERFELRDPFAETLYTSSHWSDMVAKAEQLGSRRFVAIAADGQRSQVDQVDGQWKRGPLRPAMPARAPALATTRDEIPDLAAATEAKERGADPAVKAAPAKRSAPLSSKSSLPQIDAEADRSARVAQLEAALKDRYLIKRAAVTIGETTLGRLEYRFRGDSTRVAFTESTFKLSTDTNSPSVARSMIDVAEARNWRALRVSGNEEFKRLVWLEASVRGVKALGYEPNPADLDALAKERAARQRNHIEAAPEAAATTPASQAAQAAQKGNSGRGGGRKAVIAAIEAILVAKQVPERQREAVLAAASEQLTHRLRAGQTPKVAVFDREAASQRVGVPTPDRTRTRERSALAR